MEETILAQKTGFGKSRKLLEMIPRRGSFAFATFCTALDKAGQNYLARQLLEQPSDNEFNSKQQKTCDKYEELCCLHIGDDFYVSGCQKEGQVQLHIGQYQKYKPNGKIYPTKRGVVLSPSEWLILESYVASVDTVLQIQHTLDTDCKWYISNDIFITQSPKYPTVDIRRFWKPKENGKFAPTKNGVALTFAMWNRLKDVMMIIRSFIPQLDDVSAISNVQLTPEPVSTHQHLSDLQCDCGEIDYSQTTC